MRVMSWNPQDEIEDFRDLFEGTGGQPRKSFEMPQSDLSPDGWRIERKDVLNLLDKLRAAGTPLGKYVNGRFYYGIKTGLNEAFVVDRATRDQLIAEHKSSEEVLKPFLRGRDVKRWRIDDPDLWLIFTRRPFKIDKYPAIKKHLEQFKDQLMPGVQGGRKAGSYEWYEIQDNIAYWKEFETPKILYQEIATYQAFAWNETKAYTNNKTFLISDTSKSLLSILNSKLFYFILDNSVQKMAGDAFAMQSIYLEKLPIAKPTPELEKLLTQLVDYILLLSAQPSGVQVQAVVRYWEQVIDALVYELYLPDVLHAAGRFPLQTIGAVQWPVLSGDAARDLQAIQGLYATLFDPQHEVRKLVFYLDSIPEVRIIEGKDKP